MVKYYLIPIALQQQFCFFVTIGGGNCNVEYEIIFQGEIDHVEALLQVSWDRV